MLQAIFNRQITKAEQQLGVSLDYVRYVARVSRSAAWRLARFSRLVQTRPRDEWREAVLVGSIVAAMADDCGSCVQIGVNLARQAGLDRNVISAVVERRPEELSADLQEVYHFTEAVIFNTEEQESRREQIRRRFGDAGLVELSLAIALHRVFPALKRGLGYAATCSRVTVAV